MNTEEQLARINNLREEALKFDAEQRKFAAEREKLYAEREKLSVERERFYFETLKLERDRKLSPLLVASAVGGTVGALVVLAARGLGL